MESEYLGFGWISRKKTIRLEDEELDNSLEEYSFEEASIYLNSFTVNQMASLTSTPPSRRMLDITSTICRRAMISPYCMILGLAYAQEYHRKCTQNPYITKLNTLDLFLVSMIISNKFLIDSGEYEAITNREWAKLSKKPLHEVNTLETMFLNAIEWKLYMSQGEFNKFSQEIEAQIVTDLVKRRGYCTYREILSLFNWAEFNAKFHTSVINMGVAFLSSFAFYLTGVLALSVAVKGLACFSQASSGEQHMTQGRNSLERKEIIIPVNSSPEIPFTTTTAPEPNLEIYDFMITNSNHTTDRVDYSYICDTACLHALSPLNMVVSPPYILLRDWHTLDT